MYTIYIYIYMYIYIYIYLPPTSSDVNSHISHIFPLEAKTAPGSPRGRESARLGSPTTVPVRNWD